MHHQYLFTSDVFNLQHFVWLFLYHLIIFHVHLLDEKQTSCWSKHLRMARGSDRSGTSSPDYSPLLARSVRRTEPAPTQNEGTKLGAVDA